MVKRHLKRLFMPKTWELKKKCKKFVTRPHPSGHPLDNTLSLNMLLRDVLNLAKTRKEVKKILQHNEIYVNGKVQKDEKNSIGLLDILSIKELNKNYRIVMDSLGRLNVKEVDKKETELIPCKITGKTYIKKGKKQLNCFNGFNIITEDDTKYKVGDVILYDYVKKKIVESYHLEKGAKAYIIRGKYRGTLCDVDKIEKNTITFTANKQTYVTNKDYALALGKQIKITC